MKDIIDLKALKKSRSKKHQKIYEKAHRIMKSSFETPDLKNSEVMEIASKFPSLNVNILMGGDITVRSLKDTWIIRDEGRFYTLYHGGSIFSHNRIKEHYHIQDIFSDLSYIFASIISHDEYALGIRRRNAYEVAELIKE